MVLVWPEIYCDEMNHKLIKSPSLYEVCDTKYNTSLDYLLYLIIWLFSNAVRDFLSIKHLCEVGVQGDNLMRSMWFEYRVTISWDPWGLSTGWQSYEILFIVFILIIEQCYTIINKKYRSQNHNKYHGGETLKVVTLKFVYLCNNPLLYFHSKLNI